MQKIESIQLLRGAAATLVAAFHLNSAGISETGYSGFFSLFRHGEAGVDIFFVISGFIIYFTAQAKTGQTVGQFLSARFWRIYPPYWAITLLYLGLGLGLALVLGDHSKLYGARTLLNKFLLVPYPDFVIVIAWTLSIEVVLYLVFAFSFLTGGKRLFFAVMAVWVLLSQLAKLPPLADVTILALPLHSAVLEFLFGAGVAVAYLNGYRAFHLPALAAGTVLICLFLLGVFDGLHYRFGREFMPGIPAALLVYGILGLKLRLHPALLVWGESSYILYLLHLLLFSVIGRAAEMALGINVYGSTVAMLAMLAIAVIISGLATLYLERPYQAWYQRRRGYSSRNARSK